MKILILTNKDVGLYKFRKELLEAFRDSGYEVIASLPPGEFVQNIEALGCKVVETELNRRGTNPFEDIRLYKTYRKLIREIRPDVVLTYTIKPNVYGGIACQLEKVPYIANITGLGTALENPGILQFITKHLYRTGIRKAEVTYFQNQDNLDFMVRNRIVSGRYDLIPGSGVNLSQYEYHEYPDDKTVHFVFAGRMMAEKGFEEYLNCAEYIHGKYPNTLFHICGIKEENYYVRVEDLTKKGVCVYHGLVDDMKAIYDECHCTILPTYYPEGMSNVLQESLACGRPIITTDRPGCREIVEDGVNGFVVKARDSADVIAKVEKFLSLSNKERAQLGLNGRRKVEERFDRKIVVDKYMAEIKKYVRES